MKIAITGKIAAGKSFVVEEIRKILPDYHYANADKIAKWVREIDEFKQLLIDEHGTTNPAILSKYISTSNSLSIISRQVIHEIGEMLKVYENIIIEAPTLLNYNPIPWKFDKILFITTTPGLQAERLKARGYTPEIITAFLSNQNFDEHDKRITHLIKNVNNPEYLNERLRNALL